MSLFAVQIGRRTQIVFCSFLILSVALTAPSALAQRPKPKIARPGKPDINTKITSPKVVRVVNESNEPVADAEVRVGWWDDAEGDSLHVIIVDPPKTDSKGEVLIDVPQGAVRAQISARAPNYAAGGSQYLLTGEPKIILQSGRIVRVKAVDTDGNPVEQAIPLLEESRAYPREFKSEPENPGVFVSPVVKPDRRWMRVIDANGDGPVRFSELIDVYQPEKYDEQGNILATLRPGVRLEGKLDDSVPRPVHGGCIELFIKQGDQYRIEEQGWTWQDTETIQPDGTFTFDSLPAGGHVQLVAVVNGYQSKRPTQASLINTLLEKNSADIDFVSKTFQSTRDYWPQLFPLPINQETVHVELECVPTASADIAVIDPLGNPVPEATVRVNPNGIFVGGPLFIPGSEGFTEASRVRDNKEDRTKIRQWAHDSFLRVKTDQEGIARVRCLAGDAKHTFKLDVEGFQLPYHPTSSPNYRSRYATLEVTPGETTKRTVTLETLRTSGERELSVLDSEAKPLEEITVIVTDVAFEGDEDNWHLWSVPRFGEVIEGTSDDGGRISLEVPLEVGGRKVAALKVFLKGRLGRRASAFGQRLVIPPTDDGRVIVLTISEEPPRDEHSFRDALASYVRPEEVFTQPPKQLLDQLVKQPSLIVLKQLLAAAKYDGAAPLEFHASSNSINFNDPAPVVVIETEKGRRVVALCLVEAASLTPSDGPKTNDSPYGAYIFDAEDASLIGMAGGWSSSKGRPCQLRLTDLGTRGDYFFQMTAYEDNGPFNQIHQWTLVDEPDSPALTYYAHSRDPAWSADSHQADQLSAEFGYLAFRGTASERDRKKPGWIENGAKVPRKIFWDGRRNTFQGLPTVWMDDESLYEVDLKRSARFEPFKVSPNDMIVGGGSRSFKNWHAWDVAIPEGRPAQLQLQLVKQAPGEEESIVETFYDEPLPGGQHFLQLEVGNDEDAEDQSTLEWRVGETGKAPSSKYEAPHVSMERTASVVDTPVLRADEKQLELMRRPTDHENVSLVLRLVRP